VPNTICKNHESFKHYLSAHRAAFGHARDGRNLEILLGFSPLIVCLIIYQLGHFLFPKADAGFPNILLNLSALAGMLVLMVSDIVLEPIRAAHRRAANLDLEAYDTATLGMPWHEAVAGARPNPESLSKQANEYENDMAGAHPPELSLDDSWYPGEIEDLELELARFLCLRQNVSFEYFFRKQYIQLFLVPMLILISILVMIQIFLFGAGITAICCTLVTASPVFRLLIKGLLTQNKNCRTLEEIKSDIEKALQNKEELTTENARRFQDRLFLTRDSLPLMSIAGFKLTKLKYLPLLKQDTVELIKRTVQTLIIALTCLSLTACSVDNLIGSVKQLPQKQTVAAEVALPVKQPDLKNLLSVSSKIKIVASGSFKPGSYWSNGKQLSFSPDTNFEVDVEMPVESADSISTRSATGFLRTSKEFSVNALPVPKEIQLKEGKASGEVEFGKWLGAFFVNLLQLASNDGGLRDTIANMQIKSARLELKPGARLCFGEKSVIVGQDSTITLSDVAIDKDLNYKGDLVFDLNFEKGCDWLGKKVDVRFNGGYAKLYLIAEGRGKGLKLGLNTNHPLIIDNRHMDIRLEDCRFNFGHNKQSVSLSRTAEIDIKELTWERRELKEPTLFLKSVMNLTDTACDISTGNHQSKLTLPGILHTILNIDTTGSESITHFETEGSAVAKAIAVTINKAHSNLLLLLEDGLLGPVNFDKFGTLDFSLKEGKAHLKSFEWQSGDNSFALYAEGNSTLSVPSEMLLQKKNKSTKTSMSLPIDIAVGTANFKLGDTVTQLEDLKGRLRIDVEGEIEMESDLDFNIKHSTLFKNDEADVRVRGLDLKIGDKSSNLNLKNCQVLVTNKALAAAIQTETPSQFDLKLNKVLVENKHWRYRNAIGKEVKVENLKLLDMKARGPGVLDFKASADAVLLGSVEKCGLFIGKDKWQTKPWKLAGHLEGSGSVKYQFSKEAGKLSQLDYQLSLQLPLPEDMELDWSEVGAGLLKSTEKHVILSHLRQITVPVSHKGTIDLFADQKWKNLKIVKLEVKPSETGAEVVFSASSKL